MTPGAREVRGRIDSRLWGASRDRNADAYPVRERARAEATATAPRQTTLRSSPADSVEIPSGGGSPRRTGFRGTTQSGDATSGYTLWQGYYWYHNPTAGWHYWDGSRWTRF